MLNKVISVCTRKDASTFEMAAPYITKYIPAKSFIVLVPEVDLSYFLSLKLGAFNVVSEEKYSNISSLLSEKNLGTRFGWYLQQFIKMAELDDGNLNDINIIWDADTIPLREIQFEKDGKLFFFQGKEHHKPYFKLIKSLLGVEKIVATSFIAQCLPYRVGWFQKFKREIQNGDDGSWFEEIIKLIDIKENSSFSEYETLGTYAAKNFKSEMLINEHTDDWYRFGNSLIGSPQNIAKYQNKLNTRYNFISFESWDKKRISFIKIFLKLRLGM
jgi:hypothetical protein